MRKHVKKRPKCLPWFQANVWGKTSQNYVCNVCMNFLGLIKSQNGIFCSNIFGPCLTLWVFFSDMAESPCWAVWISATEKSPEWPNCTNTTTNKHSRNTVTMSTFVHSAMITDSKNSQKKTWQISSPIILKSCAVDRMHVKPVYA